MTAPPEPAVTTPPQPLAGPPGGDPPRPGRPRDDARDVVILESTLELLADVGYERLTMDAVAAHARASKATIYRRWPGKAQLVVDALRRRVDAHAELPDQASLRADLLEAVRHTCAKIAGVDGGLLCGLAGAARRDPELAACIKTMCDEKAGGFDPLVARAVARGELAPGADGRVLTEVVSGLVVFHAVQGDDLGEALAVHLVDDVALPLLIGSVRS